jgi:hypothetical protein
MVTSAVNLSKTELAQSGNLCSYEDYDNKCKIKEKKTNLKVIRIFHDSCRKEGNGKKGKVTEYFVLPSHSVHTDLCVSAIRV